MLGKNHDDDPVAKKTDSTPTVFAVICSRIKSGSHGSLEDFPSVGKVKAVLTDILLVLIFVPFEFHERSVVGSSSARQAYVRRNPSDETERKVEQSFADDRLPKAKTFSVTAPGQSLPSPRTSQQLGAGFPLTLELSDPSRPKKSWVKISQIRTLSVQRLGKKLGKATPQELEDIIEGLNEIIEA